jgi:hypothetical protein
MPRSGLFRTAIEPAVRGSADIIGRTPIQLPKGLRKRPQRVAIDLTLVPYPSQPHQRLEEIYRSQAKSGTTHFHAYATAYIVRRGQRFTVALIRVE